MKTFALLAICTLFLLPLSASPASALSPTPERLVYDISWTGLSAATAVQEVNYKGDEVHIVSTTKSAKWLNPFFPVNDRAEAILKKGGGSDYLVVPKIYREKINEGRFHTNKEAVFDIPQLKVETKDFLKKTEKVDPISARTFDSLSCIYAVRGMDLTVGKSIFIDIYDCKKLWKTEVQIVKREEIKTPLGKFKCLVVKPLLRSEGFFARTGDVTVWITDDALRIPVKMTTKVKIGKITAVLIGGSYWPKQEE
ncbi:DUF3108 domain-containing protein [Geomonas sp. Red32]|uniref:DUF3108 domain-containing protein n=1 Tax=Geomonas sp. Red32 TaxID=2912856 RepID=UPI00202CEC5C|nr:DUF3108 domain-containing protein [Geomonas sp. Red32]MCM0082775.1 DUF3108 domain-containing protein [Geomonas sp. Red32]